MWKSPHLGSDTMNTKTQTTLGDIISVLYDEFLAVYGDEDVAAVAVAATVNDWLGKGSVEGASPQSLPPPAFGNPAPAAA